jgi:hypothetical protein
VKTKRYWFKRRRYGYGYMPVTWEGWLAVTAYVAIVVVLVPAFLDAPEETAGREAGFFFLFLAAATACLLMVSVKNGPKPRWRWGRKPDDNPDEDF